MPIPVAAPFTVLIGGTGGTVTETDPLSVHLTGGTMTGTLTAPEYDFSTGWGGSLQMFLDGSAPVHSVVMGNNNYGVQLGRAQVNTALLYLDQSTGDLMVYTMNGTNAGKSVNLTSGKWA